MTAKNSACITSNTAKTLTREEVAMLLFAEDGMSPDEMEISGGAKVCESLAALGYLTFNTKRDIWHLTHNGAFIVNEICPNPTCQIVLALADPIPFNPEVTGENDMRVIWNGKCPKCGYTQHIDERDPLRFVMILANEQKLK